MVVGGSTKNRCDDSQPHVFHALANEVQYVAGCGAHDCDGHSPCQVECRWVLQVLESKVRWVVDRTCQPPKHVQKSVLDEQKKIQSTFTGAP